MFGNVVDIKPRKEMELKYGQDDMKDIRVIAEATKRVMAVAKQVPHTVLVWEGCKIKSKLQQSFYNSKDKFEQRIAVVENKTIPVDTLVVMNKDGEPIEAIEIDWYDGRKRKSQEVDNV